MLGLLLAAVLVQEPTELGSAPSKKDAFLADKAEAGSSEARRRPLRAGDLAQRPIWAHNLRTHEIRTLDGPAALTEQSERSEFFRCWFTDQQGPIPALLIDRILAGARHFEVREVRIISGFRAPKYNLMLVKKGREVAKQSEHTEGMAIDFFLPGIPTRTLYDWMLVQHDGGVGFYPVSEFVHIDTGRKRTWKGT
ncbi:YcbK family protein [Nannocystaceae bacterium ST9]